MAHRKMSKVHKLEDEALIGMMPNDFNHHLRSLGRKCRFSHPSMMNGTLLMLIKILCYNHILFVSLVASAMEDMA